MTASPMDLQRSATLPVVLMKGYAGPLGLLEVAEMSFAIGIAYTEVAYKRTFRGMMVSVDSEAVGVCSKGQEVFYDNSYMR